MKFYIFRCARNTNTWKNYLIFVFIIIAIIILYTHFLRQIVSFSFITSEQNTESSTEFQTFMEKNDKKKENTFSIVREFVLNPSVSKFVNENARIVGFQYQNYKNLSFINSSKKIIYLATPYFGEWNPEHFYSLHLGGKTFLRYSCPIYNCHVTKDPSNIHQADALLFHVRDLEVFSIPRRYSLSQVWILYSMEPPWLEIKDMRRFNGIFNWTMSYRRKSDILMKYGFIGRIPHPMVKLSRLKERLISLRTKQNKAVWFVSNCNTDSNREEYIKKMRKIYPVDVFGGCGVEFCRPAETQKCYTRVAMRYKFYIAFENAICRDYVTEKLFNPLNYDIIPVVLGGADYSAVAPHHSVINAMDFNSPEDLGGYLWKVSKSNALYLSYFWWKNIYKPYLQPWMCDLCAKLHESSVPQTWNDLEQWWN
ncbi:unnamed protein product, partial [Larinioides sclopetarius]